MPESQRTYIAIDLKSFYASVECLERGLDPLDTNLVVADESSTQKTICLAVSPSLKSYGISGRARLFEAVQRVKEVNAQRRRDIGWRPFTQKSCSASILRANPDYEVDFIIAAPRMSHYIDFSTRIYKIYLKYIAPEDIHVYSIDEVFIDATAYLKSMKLTAHELAMTMISDILGVQENLYYPFGMLMAESSDIVDSGTPDNNRNRYFYGGKEYLPAGGVNLYDFTGRYYDPCLISFVQQDCNQEKYMPIYPYLYCLGRPIDYIDPDGRDVAILNKNSNENIGHLAILIEKAKGVWEYFSVNGDNFYISGHFYGGRPKNDLTIGPWESPEAFLNSSYNVSNGEKGKYDESINSYDYKEAFVISTTPEQDKIIRETFINIAKNETYKLLSSNCATTVERSLRAAGIKVAVPDMITKSVPTNFKYAIEGDSYKVPNILIMPNKAFKSIMENNPNGRYIKKDD